MFSNAIHYQKKFVALSVFLMLALALAVPTGYSYGAGLLLLGSVFFLIRKNNRPTLDTSDLVIIFAFLLFFTSYLIEFIHPGQTTRILDKPSRFLLAIPVLMMLIKSPPKASYFWSGVVAGAFLAALIATWQKLFLGLDRANGFLLAIQFGNLSMLFGLTCLSGLGWASIQTKKNIWITILILGFIFGFIASLLSGSRGGWIGLPFVLLVIYKAYSPWLNKKLLAIAVTAGLFLASLGFFIPQTGVQARVNSAINDLQAYNAGYTNTSLGIRFELWKGSILMAIENPMLGHGSSGFEQKLIQYRDSGTITPGIISHAHNEYLDALGKRGIIGLIALLALYLVPLRLFLTKNSKQDLVCTSYAAAGSVLCVTYIDFGLSQVFLAHNSGVMIFAFLLPVIWSLFKSSSQSERDNQ